MKSRICDLLILFNSYLIDKSTKKILNKHILIPETKSKKSWDRCMLNTVTSTVLLITFLIIWESRTLIFKVLQAKFIKLILAW